MKLLETSALLPGMDGGEVTPVRAWVQIMKDPRVKYMTAQDFDLVKTDLLGKARCYGYVSRTSWHLRSH